MTFNTQDACAIAIAIILGVALIFGWDLAG